MALIFFSGAILFLILEYFLKIQCFSLRYILIFVFLCNILLNFYLGLFYLDFILFCSAPILPLPYFNLIEKACKGAMQTNV